MRVKLVLVILFILTLLAGTSPTTAGERPRQHRNPYTLVTVASDGTGDYADIGVALENLPSGFVDFYIKKGTYVLPEGSGSPQPAQIHARSDMIIRGDGIGETILLRSSKPEDRSNVDMIGTFDRVENLVIQDLTLDGMYVNQPNIGGSCIVFSHNNNVVSKNVILRRVEAKNARACFNARNIIGTSWSDFGLIIEDCAFSHGWTGATWANCYYVKITGCDISYTGNDGILPDSTYKYLEGTGGDGACHHFIIEENYCHVNGDTGIDLAAHTKRGDARHTDLSARFNLLVCSQARITGCDDVVFSDNVIYNKFPLPSDAPINANEFRGGISCDSGESGSNNVDVSRNKVQPSASSDRSIRFEETNGLICKNNIVYGSGSPDIYLYNVSGFQRIIGNQITTLNMPSRYWS